MSFEEQKKVQLEKKDASIQGEIDIEIRYLVDKLNEYPFFYTTSSCAGRTLLLSKKSDKKFNIQWIYKDHKEANLKKIQETLKELPDNPVWIKQESAILHICCKDMETAERLLVICKNTGFKFSGILSTKKRIIVQVMSSENLETIVADKKQLLISEEYLIRLVDECNKRMERNISRIKRLHDGIVEEFK
jgi:tRNA wybutosine-synthesizing protein 3|tara:strand:+ start:1133 stop:1702 length:570 start_codon:yes stop_codon:yes gene_type:complete